MGSYFFVRTIFGLCNGKKMPETKLFWDSKISRGIGQVSVQFSKWHAILSRSNSWQCNWLECALLHRRVPCFLPYLLKIVKRKETHKMWYWYLCQKLFLHLCCFIYILDSSNSSSFTFWYINLLLALEATEVVTQMALELKNNHFILVQK